MFKDLKWLKLKVPKICLIIECVSARRDRRYPISKDLLMLSKGVE
jgi:hypothetical protein